MSNEIFGIVLVLVYGVNSILLITSIIADVRHSKYADMCSAWSQLMAKVLVITFLICIPLILILDDASTTVENAQIKQAEIYGRNIKTYILELEKRGR